MTQTKDHRGKDSAAATQASPKQAAGYVEFDSRGNSVWRWVREAIDSTSILLKRLENIDLALEPTQKVPAVRAADRRPAHSPKRVFAADLSLAEPDGRDSGGFDPYNSR